MPDSSQSSLAFSSMLPNTLTTIHLLQYITVYSEYTQSASRNRPTCGLSRTTHKPLLSKFFASFLYQLIKSQEERAALPSFTLAILRFGETSWAILSTYTLFFAFRDQGCLVGGDPRALARTSDGARFDPGRGLSKSVVQVSVWNDVGSCRNQMAQVGKDVIRRPFHSKQVFEMMRTTTSGFVDFL